MTWFKVDDGWHKHRKRIRAGLDLEGFAARGLWVDAGSWSSDELTDGFIPDDVLDYMAPGLGQMLAKRLEHARLWVRVERGEESGWQFHQWGEHQPTKEEVEAALSKKATGGKLGNHRRWHVEKGKFDDRCPYCHESDDRITDRSTDRTSDRSTESGANPPSRPDPTSSSNEEERAPAAPASQEHHDELGGDDTTKKGTRLPDDFRVTDPMVAWARDKCPDVDGRTETDKFVRYWQAKPGKDALKLSWKRTWQNWMTSAQQRLTNQQAGRMNGGMKAESNAPKNYTPANRCKKHPSQPKTTCGSCRGERLKTQQDQRLRETA